MSMAEDNAEYYVVIDELEKLSKYYYEKERRERTMKKIEDLKKEAVDYLHCYVPTAKRLSWGKDGTQGFSYKIYGTAHELAAQGSSTSTPVSTADNYTNKTAKYRACLMIHYLRVEQATDFEITVSLFKDNFTPHDRRWPFIERYEDPYANITIDDNEVIPMVNSYGTTNETPKDSVGLASLTVLKGVTHVDPKLLEQLNGAQVVVVGLTDPVGIPMECMFLLSHVDRH